MARANPSTPHLLTLSRKTAIGALKDGREAGTCAMRNGVCQGGFQLALGAVGIPMGSHLWRLAMHLTQSGAPSWNSVGKGRLRKGRKPSFCGKDRAWPQNGGMGTGWEGRGGVPVQYKRE